MASPMYSTGIGLVIEGIQRYEKEKDKMKASMPVVEEVVPVEEETRKKKERKPRKAEASSKKFTDSFVENIRKWFEEDNE